MLANARKAMLKIVENCMIADSKVNIPSWDPDLDILLDFVCFKLKSGCFELKIA